MSGDTDVRSMDECCGSCSNSQSSAAARTFGSADLVKPRVKKVRDSVPQLEPFLRERVDYDPAAVEKHLGAAGLADHIAALGDAYQTLDAFDVATIETALRQVAEDRGVKAGALIHATRVALTGKAVSPGLFEVAALVGQAGTVARLRELERFLRARAA